jgi:undecaprenyl phosphate-alpha-L-ara4N flippase subunit ArnE
MTPTVTGILLVVAAAMVESFAQIFLKIGAAGGPGILMPPFRHHALRLPAGASGKLWLSLGVLAYLAEIFLYTLALYFLDVSVAFPMGSLCFIGIALLSKWVLGESVSRTRWLGIGCILGGTILVAL